MNSSTPDTQAPSPVMPSIFAEQLPFVVYGPRHNAHLNHLNEDGSPRATRPASAEEFDMYCLMADANSRVNRFMAEKALEANNMIQRLSDYDIALGNAIVHAPELARVPLEQRLVELKRLTGKVIGVSNG